MCASGGALSIMANCSKCKLNKNEGMVGCEATCNKWFHYSCVGLTNVEFSMLSKSKNLFYMCDECKHTCDILDKPTLTDYNTNMKDVRKHVLQVTEIVGKKLDGQLEEFNKLFEGLKADVLNSIKAQIECTVNEHIKLSTPQYIDSHCSIKNTTYANAANAKSSFLITPKVIQDPAVTKADMFLNVNPLNTHINLTKVKNVRDGGLLISCENDNESVTFKEVAAEKLSNKYTIKEVSSLNPRIRVVGISEKLEDDVLLNYIKTQNKYIFSDQGDCKIISNVPLKKKNNIYQATIQVDRGTYKNIMHQGKLFVGYDYCSVFDAIELRRCYKCCGYHHISKNCTSNVEFCPRCAQPHKLTDCKSDVLCCINCRNFKKNKGNNISINLDHASWDNTCHVYKLTLEKFKNNILGSQ